MFAVALGAARFERSQRNRPHWERGRPTCMDRPWDRGRLARIDRSHPARSYVAIHFLRRFFIKEDQFHRQRKAFERRPRMLENFAP